MVKRQIVQAIKPFGEEERADAGETQSAAREIVPRCQ